MIGATSRQTEIVVHVARYVRANGIAPTVRELADALGITSTNGVVDHLLALERKGLIERAQGKSRAVVLTTVGEIEALRAFSDAELLAELEALQVRRERVCAVVAERTKGGASCPT